MARKSLLTIGNPKTLKGERKGYLTAILHLAPANEAGLGTVCAMATDGCKLGCLYRSGHGGIVKAGETTNAVLEARKRRTAWYKLHREAFEATLSLDIAAFVRTAERKGLTPCVRVNGTSDQRGLALAMARQFPNVQFYDYTKLPVGLGLKLLPANYHLTFSRSESNADAVQAAMNVGLNVAVVFSTRKGQPLPATYLGRPVIDGDEHDLRFTDPQGVVVGLRAKGPARKDTTGFVIQV